MTVSELRAALAGLDDDMPVRVHFEDRGYCVGIRETCLALSGTNLFDPDLAMTFLLVVREPERVQNTA